MHNQKFYCLLTAVAVVFSFVSVANAEKSTAPEDKSYTLKYKFQMGEILRYEVEHSTNVRSTIEETTQQAESKSESVKAWKVTDVLPNGEMEFIHVVESVKMSNQVPNQGLRVFDSKSGEAPPQGFEQAARAVGVPLSLIRISPSGKIVDREEKHPQPAAREDMPITLQLPENPVAVGDKWDRTYNVTVDRKSGGEMKIRTRRLCTLKQVKSGIATIAVEYQILTPVNSFIESQLVERLAKGTVRFDITKGRIDSQKFNTDRRILGFAGGTSSMHFRSRLEERLIKPSDKLARKSEKTDETK